jgi:hypothetical protein
MSNDTSAGIHVETTHMDIHDLVALLNSHLGATLVAILADVRDSKFRYRWAKEDGPTPGIESEKRLIMAYRVWRVLESAESSHVARNWFIGCNPLLGEESPIMALRDGRLSGVISAAEAFLEGAWQA